MPILVHACLWWPILVQGYPYGRGRQLPVWVTMEQCWLLLTGYSLRSSRFLFLKAKRGKRARALGKKEQKSRSGGGGGGGAGKERKRLPLSPDILPNAVRQRTGCNDVLQLDNRLSIKLIDQNDIRLTVYTR